MDAITLNAFHDELEKIAKLPSYLRRAILKARKKGLLDTTSEILRKDGLPARGAAAQDWARKRMYAHNFGKADARLFGKETKKLYSDYDAGVGNYNVGRQRRHESRKMLERLNEKPAGSFARMDLKADISRLDRLVSDFGKAKPKANPQDETIRRMNKIRIARNRWDI